MRGRPPPEAPGENLVWVQIEPEDLDAVIATTKAQVRAEFCEFMAECGVCAPSEAAIDQKLIGVFAQIEQRYRESPGPRRRELLIGRGARRIRGA